MVPVSGRAASEANAVRQEYAYRKTGTNPVSVAAEIREGEITPEADAANQQYLYAATGTKPHISMEKSADAPGISGDADGKSFGVTYKKCGQKKL